MSDETCVEKEKGWFLKYIVPNILPLIFAFIVSSAGAYTMIQINTADQKNSKEKIVWIEEKVDQETKRNNIQDVGLSKLQEKVSNQDLTLSRIELTVDNISASHRESSKDMIKEMRKLVSAQSSMQTDLAVLKDRANRKEEENK